MKDIDMSKPIPIDDDFQSEVRDAESKKQYKVLLPAEYVETYCGPLYGYFVENTGVFNVVVDVCKQSKQELKKIGYIQSLSKVECDELDKLKEFGVVNGQLVLKPHPPSESDSPPVKMPSFRPSYERLGCPQCLSLSYLIGKRSDSGLTFSIEGLEGEKVDIETYSFIADAFSRTKGIIESAKMLNKKAVIVGCGSGGSFIALQLARVGVGNFLLVDNDVFGYHNISRHQCGIYDVGKRKVDAMKERVLEINPKANVVTYHEMVQDIYRPDLLSYIDKNTIILSCGDNRASAHYSNKISEMTGAPFIAAGAGHRASTGEIFYYIPQKDLPCYACVFGEDLNKDFSNEQTRVWYDTQTEERKAAFEPGLTTDIDFISVIVVKLAVDLLFKNDKKYVKKVLDYLPQFTALSNYICDKKLNPMIQIFNHPLEIKTTIATAKREDCYLCETFGELKRNKK